jgi:hypothetical protein
MLQPAGGKIVGAAYAIAAIEKRIGQLTSDESGDSSNMMVHRPLLTKDLQSWFFRTAITEVPTSF